MPVCRAFGASRRCLRSVCRLKRVLSVQPPFPPPTAAHLASADGRRYFSSEQYRPIAAPLCTLFTGQIMHPHAPTAAFARCDGRVIFII